MIRLLIGFWFIAMAIGAAMSVMIACDDEDVKAAVVFFGNVGINSCDG